MNEMDSSVLMMEMRCGLINLKIASKMMFFHTPKSKVSPDIDSLRKLVQGHYVSCSRGFCLCYRTAAMNDMDSSVLIMDMCCGLINLKTASKSMCCHTQTAKVSP